MTSWLGTGKSLSFFYSVLFAQFCVISFVAASGAIVRICFAARSNFSVGLYNMIILIQRRTLQIPCLDLRFTQFGGRTDAKKKTKCSKAAESFVVYKLYMFTCEGLIFSRLQLEIYIQLKIIQLQMENLTRWWNILIYGKVAKLPGYQSKIIVITEN